MRPAFLTVVLILLTAASATADEDTKKLTEAVQNLNNTVEKKGSGWVTSAIVALASVVSGLLGAGVSFLVARWWNNRNKPVLEMTIDLRQGSEYLQPLNTGEDPPVLWKYLRLRVTNIKREAAKKCRGYLTAVEKLEGDTWIKAGYHDVLQLPWSYYSPDDASDLEKDIIKGVYFFLDICRLHSVENKPSLCLIKSIVNYGTIIENPARYRLSLLFTGENFDPQTVSVEIAWHGEFDKIGFHIVG
jgi:hypothetical protein